MSENMVDRVALAIASAASVDAGFSAILDLDDVETPDHWRAQARAAIAAMREPTNALVVAGSRFNFYQSVAIVPLDGGPTTSQGQYHQMQWGEVRQVWVAMIDAALSSSVPATSGPSGLDMPDMG